MIRGLLAAAMERAVARRNAAFDAGRRPLVRVDRPVISVGNLSVGGTGKTPMVEWVVRSLLADGLRPAIVARGYRRRDSGLVVVHDGESVVADAAQGGDEPLLLARRCDVPVVVARYKADAAVYAAGFLPCDVVVVDDGFQHRSLHRDLDIVLVDQATLARPWLLPRGRLREPLASLGRADAAVLMGDGPNRSLVGGFVADTTVVARAIPVMDTTEVAPAVVAVAGIANPERFRDGLLAAGISVTAFRPFPDHHRYTKRDLLSVIDQATKAGVPVALTEKDAVKLDLSVFSAHGVAVCVVPLTVTITEAADALATLLRQRSRSA